MAKNIKTVEIILTCDVDNLGKKGEVKIVRLGYFSNYLMPQKKAVLATEQEKKNQAQLTQIKKEKRTQKKESKKKKEKVLSQKKVKNKRMRAKINKK